MNKLLGIFGGSFDPVHFGHLNSIWELQIKIHFDRLHIIPCAQSALKNKHIASPNQRLEMLQLATKGQKDWIIDDREIKQAKISYTIDTLKSLQQDFPEHHLCLIISVDAAMDFQKWHQWQSIFDLAHVIIMSRSDHDFQQIAWLKDAEQPILKSSDELFVKNHGGILLQDITNLNISSSRIRKMCQQKNPPPFLLPLEVWQYIQDNRLYLNT